MTHWHSSVEAAKAEARDAGLEPYTVEVTRVEDLELDFPPVWYRCESKNEEPVWRNRG